MNLQTLIENALDEDIGAGDLTTLACVPAGTEGRATINAKQKLVVCGHDAVREVFEAVCNRYGGKLVYREMVADGTEVGPEKTPVARVSADKRVLLMGERLALNLMMRMSGIATNVRAFVDAAGENGPRVVDTRKTTPLHRALEKYAVRCGGAYNHRFALYDGIMVKDNHIQAVGSLTKAVEAVRDANHHLVRVEVEVTNEDELREALATDADVILLDNMDDDALASAVAISREIRPSVILEASGNINPERIRGIAEKGIGVDVVSSGGLIHQARWVDLSMEMH